MRGEPGLIGHHPEQSAKLQKEHSRSASWKITEAAGEEWVWAGADTGRADPKGLLWCPEER